MSESEGRNFVELIGKLKYTSFRVFDNNSCLFKCKVAVPAPNDKRLYQYVKAAAWGVVAEALDKVSPHEMIRIFGHIEEQVYEGQCRHCKGYDKKYYTEVIIDNFKVVD